MESYVETVSGRKFYFLDPQPEDFDIHDIAHALSMNCRYTGHSNKFYSVAEHCWQASRFLGDQPVEVQLAALLHDGSEAYITDIASPIKQHLPDYKKMEDNIMGRLFEKYGLKYPFDSIIKFADLSMLSIEAKHLLTSGGDTWDMWKTIKRPMPDQCFRPIGFQPKQAKALFLEKFYELTDEKVC